MPATRELLAAADVPFRIVGGVAVIHHGYVRTTEDIDVLVGEGGRRRIDRVPAAHGFVRKTPHRLRHTATGVDVHVLVAGEAMPRPGAPP